MEDAAGGGGDGGGMAAGAVFILAVLATLLVFGFRGLYLPKVPAADE